MNAILAVNKLGYIGINDSLPWRSPDDLKHFKRLTLDKKCLVGRKTFESLPPLKNRHLIVVGSGEGYYSSIQEAIEKEQPDIVIGGRSIYEQTLHLCNTLYLSIIDNYTEGNVNCPDLTKFNGEIQLFNFKSITKDEESMSIEKLRVKYKYWFDYLDSLQQFPEMNDVCRHEIFEEQLIKEGMSHFEAKITPRTLACPCPKCNEKK